MKRLASLAQVHRWLLVVRGWAPRGVPIGDVAGATVVCGFGVADFVARGYGGGWLACGVAVAALAGAAVALRTRRPVAAVALACLTLLASAVLPAPDTPLWGFIMLLLVSFSAAAHTGGRRRVALLASILATMYPLQLVAAHGVGDKLISPVVIVGAGAAAGVAVRRSRLQAARLAELAATLRAERAEHAHLAALAERARIARDVHDIVAHSVSLMVVQTGAAMALLPDGAPARQQLAAVRATGREALGELRGLLAVLRDGTDEPALAQPGMDELVDLAQRSGARVRVRGVVRPVGRGAALTAYQVVREALTNVRRHAVGADVEIDIEIMYAEQSLSIRVTDTGLVTAAGGEGHGIRGMRERAALYGGALTAGPRPCGGWEVLLRLPVATSAENCEARA